jgi:hypothetical protein
MGEEALLHKFFEGFKARDFQQMASCCHPDVHFSDAVFDLTAEEVTAMWHMLCARAKDLQLVYTIGPVDSVKGHAYWEATYTFKKTGLKVHNKVNSTFYFKDGLIIKHEDDFDFWRWSRMALGTTGFMLGWIPVFRRAFGKKAYAMLQQFIKEHPM